MSDSNNVCPFTFRANPCDSIESPPAEHWTARLLGACSEGIRAAAAYDTPEAAWAGIDRPDFLVWAVENYADAPSTTQSVRLALEAAKSVEHLHGDPLGPEGLVLVEEWLADPDRVTVEELQAAETAILRQVQPLRCNIIDLENAYRRGASPETKAGVARQLAALVTNFKALWASGWAVSAAVNAHGEEPDCCVTAGTVWSDASSAVDYASDAVAPRDMATMHQVTPADIAAAGLENDTKASEGIADLVRAHLDRPELSDYGCDF